MLSKGTISEVAGGLRKKSFSCEEVTSEYLKKINALNKKLNAYITVCEDVALSRARSVDVKIANGEKLAPMAGIPVAVKDIFNTDGVRTTCCSRILKDFIPPYSANVIKKLEEHGYILLGKTNMDEFACGGSTEHSCFGPTKNPWDLTKVPGGSSGGSAAAVSADMCVFALGTDTGGSIRQPASLCGVVGLKPTYGRISRSGVTALASSWDVVGPITKCVEDAAIVMNALAGHDIADSTTPKKPVPDYTKALTGDVRGVRIGLPEEYFGEGTDPEVKSCIYDAAKHLEEMGAKLKKISLPSTKYGVAVYYITMPAELSANLARYDAIRYGSPGKEKGKSLFDYYESARSEGFGDEIKRRIMVGTYALSAGYYDAYYKKAQKVRTLIIKEFEEAFEDVDIIIGPASPFPAFDIGGKITDPLAMYAADVLTIPASAAGIPALSVPCGFTSSGGLPIGLQLAAPQFGEELLLRVGHAYESNSDWSEHRPKI